MNEDLIKKIGVTFELCGTSISRMASKVVVGALSSYTEKQVSLALDRCALETAGRLTLSGIISKIDDGYPGVEEAWSLMPKTSSEDISILWTDEMKSAYFSIGSMLDDNDMTGARMSFKEIYTKLLQTARAEKRLVSWGVSLGHDKSQRLPVMLEAVRTGRITAASAKGLLPEHSFEQEEPVNLIADQKLKQIVGSIGK